MAILAHSLYTKNKKNTGQGPPAIPVCPTTYNFSWAAEVQFIIQNIFFF